MRSSCNFTQALYEIQVLGELDRGWDTYFNGLTLTISHTGQQLPVTVLTGVVADQSALRGLLGKLWDLNLTLISVRRVEEEIEKEIENG